MKASCSVEGCQELAHARGWCQKHYQRWTKYGDPKKKLYPLPKQVCSIESCDRLVDARGWCQKHWRRWRKYGDPAIVYQSGRKPRGKCSIEACEKPHQAHGWCWMHYSRWRKHGNPMIVLKGGAIKHGLAKDSRYMSWQAMMHRCYDLSSSGYKRYGGSGIRVCKRWHDVRNFIADMGTKPLGTSIDRIKGSGNYEPSNCRWATPKQQSWNRKSNKLTLKLANEIRARYAIGDRTQKAIGLDYGVTDGLVSMIVANKIWT